MQSDLTAQFIPPRRTLPGHHPNRVYPFPTLKPGEHFLSGRSVISAASRWRKANPDQIISVKTIAPGIVRVERIA